METKKCPDCGGEFETGVLLDAAHGGSFLSTKYGKKLDEFDNSFLHSTANNSLRETRDVIVNRCMNCNRLFFYASAELFDFKKHMKSRTIVVLVVIFLLTIILALIIMLMANL